MMTNFYQNFNTATVLKYLFGSIYFVGTISKIDENMVKNEAEWEPNWAFLSVGNPTSCDKASHAKNKMSEISEA